MLEAKTTTRSLRFHINVWKKKNIFTKYLIFRDDSLIHSFQSGGLGLSAYQEILLSLAANLHQGGILSDSSHWHLIPPQVSRNMKFHKKPSGWGGFEDRRMLAAIFKYMLGEHRARLSAKMNL